MFCQQFVVAPQGSSVKTNSSTTSLMSCTGGQKLSLAHCGESPFLPPVDDAAQQRGRPQLPASGPVNKSTSFFDHRAVDGQGRDAFALLTWRGTEVKLGNDMQRYAMVTVLRQLCALVAVVVQSKDLGGKRRARHDCPNLNSLSLLAPPARMPGSACGGADVLTTVWGHLLVFSQIGFA